MSSWFMNLWLAAAGVLVLSAPTRAQQTTDPWEFEFHGGGVLASDGPVHGNASLPAPGSPFTTAVGTPSRRTSSWYFGDGATLFNQVNTALGTTARITPLDTVLNRPLINQQSSTSIGFRLSRTISRRLAAEFGFDFSFRRWALSAPALAGIEASRASFVPAWNALMATGPFQQATVTSVSAIHDRQGRQTFTTGALIISLKTTGRVIPYATAGAGLVNYIGETPSASLTGKYQAQTFLLPINETDNVTVKSTIDGNAVGVFGGGLKYFASRRWGIRFDVRALLIHRSVSTVVNTSPSVSTVTGFATGGATATFTTPGLQFSNSAAIGPSNLSASPISGFQTFSGSRLQSPVNVAAGVFLRF